MVVNSDSKLEQKGYQYEPTNKDGIPNGIPNSISPKRVAEFPIAIVGMSCRFAGNATSPSKLWDLCVEGRDCWSPIPEDRFDINAWHHEDPQKIGKVNSRNLIKLALSVDTLYFRQMLKEATSSKMIFPCLTQPSSSIPAISLRQQVRPPPNLQLSEPAY